MHPLGIEFISVFDMPPAEFVYPAADLGCARISTVVPRDGMEPPGLRAALDGRGISISLAEGFVVMRDREVSAFAAGLDLMADLGVPGSTA